MYLNIKNGVLSTGKTLGLFKAIKNKNNGKVVIIRCHIHVFV